MFLETYPLAVNAAPKLINSDELTFESRRKSNMSFLFIGKEKEDESLRSFTSAFKYGFFAEGFVQAQFIIDGFLRNNGTLPDSIVIDMPLRKQQLEHFCVFLKSRNLLSRTPLVYNESHLCGEEVKYLRQTGLVDEVTDIHSWEINFARKMSFLKKMKNPHSSLHLTKDSTISYDHIRLNQMFSFKRIFDIVVATIGIALLLPVLLLIALAIRLESRGPVVYTSARAGRGFRIFNFYKFRTMVVGADQKIEALAHLNQYENNESGVKFLKICNDPRVTRVGRFLRNSSLDELPQLFNVLKGDMSLVGNRPLPIYEAATLTTNDCVERFMAPAGMTGLWQIKKRGQPKMSTEERISLDISYARKHNLLLDLWIIAQTPVALFQKSNA
jgi:lipopolysaccharide/colanic/teichoic acid biosynthesis glycosyltransferase